MTQRTKQHRLPPAHLLVPPRAITAIRLDGGSLCLDFVNTLEPRAGEQSHDYLASYADLVAWSQHAAGLPAQKAQQLLDAAARRPIDAARVLQQAIELREAIYSTPYDKMPYSAYWERLESAYRVGALPSKAAREAHLAEIRSVRLITLNYCPMGCTFCSATNFLHEAQGSVASIARLEAEECLHMIERIVTAHPRARTIIFQDDIFSFTRDRRILPLCEGIIAAKQSGRIPANLQFISTNRIDAMTPNPVYLASIPANRRMSRADLISTANKYFSGMQQNNGLGDYPFADEDFAVATASNAIGVLYRADEIGSCRLDAMVVAARIARRYEEHPRVHRVCPAVLPVAGLLAQAG